MSCITPPSIHSPIAPQISRCSGKESIHTQRKTVKAPLLIQRGGEEREREREREREGKQDL